MSTTTSGRIHLPFSTDAVLESLNDGFQAFDREWRYAYINRRAEQILGRSRKELLGKVCWEEYPEAVGTPFHARYLEAMETRRPVVFEFFCPHEQRWAEFSLHPYPGGLGAFTRDITDRKQAEEAVRRSEQQYHALFTDVQSAIVLADDTGRYIDANPAACELFGLSREQLLNTRVFHCVPVGTVAQAEQLWQRFLETGSQTGQFTLQRPDGTQRILEYRSTANVRPGMHLSILLDLTDRHQAEERARLLLEDLQEERETLDTVNRIGRLLSAELNLDRLVQAATDAATELTGAQFGAFFYNMLDADGGSYLLYTISGAPREAFSKFPHPRATPLFGPTFRAEGIIRSGDITQDPRYGCMEPYHGMPPDHLPVRSYLAVPVVSRSGEVLGGLFFGHEQPNVFTERAERNLVALVAQVAIAMDNARLYGQALRATEQALRASEQAQREIEERQKAEKELRLSEARQRAFLKDVLASVTEGKLRLCDSISDLPTRLPPADKPVTLSRESLRVLRHQAKEAAQAVGLNKERENDLLTAASEAAMNAVVHAGGGTGSVGSDADAGVVQVWIEDQGTGIEMSRLPRATLDRGYTTAGTLGHGFKMVLNTIDSLWLLTGASGTTVVLEQRRTPSQPGWLGEVLADREAGST